ncbi:MAG TPA: GntR family transcriptional regulator [Isosphaeraceae bacterium]|nr:GntR family transcriptional regulator [Isosphaeraceae bacterium]
MQPTISDYIEQDLSRRIGADQVLSPALTLSALSRFYGVSLTPVREAVRGLVASGILLKQGNGRILVNHTHTRTRASARRKPGPEPASRSAQLEAALAVEVIRKSLRGEAGYLREEATARQFGVGRTIIRHAFSRLAGRGLIVHVPRCGWRVRVFDGSDMIAYLETREAMELKALDLARPQLVEHDLRCMLAANKPGAQAPRLDNALHRYLVEKSGNAYIRDFFDRHGTYYTTLFDYAAPETHVVAAMARQHRAILRALIARDWPRARRTLAHHIRAQRPIVKTLMSRIGRTDNPQDVPR